MRFSKIKYYPDKSIEENATINNVSPAAIRQYIKRNKIDRIGDTARITHKNILDYKAKNPNTTKAQIAKDLGLSINTVRKHLDIPKFDLRPRKGKKSVLYSDDVLSVGVSYSEQSILKAILHYYLNGERSFHCDLTYGKGAFYSRMEKPTLKYDIHPTKPGVANLEEAKSLPDDSALKSVVIDLPCTVVNRKSQNFSSFKSNEELFETYRNMIALAWRLLKPGGILVFKTTDVKLTEDNGNIEWVSEWSLQTAKQQGFTLIDKYILIDSDMINAIQRTARRGTTHTHAYFLILQKTD